MKHSKKTFVTAVFFIFCLQSTYSQKFTVTVRSPQFQSGIAYLTYYYGKNMNVADSGAFDTNGSVIFQGDKELDPGVYSIVFPGKRASFDFLIGGEQHVSILVKDTANPVMTSVVSGSKENILFKRYQEFVAVKGTGLEKERAAFMKSTTREDSTFHEKNYAILNRELNAYRDSIMKEYPESMLAVLLKTMKEPSIPNQHPATKSDTLANYQYYKQHYWDGVTFRDARIIRTPFFLPKIERYFRQVIDQNPDSLIKESDYLILLSRTSQPMYQFLINWFTDEYYQPKVMGQDKVFVHLFEKYHSKGISTWLNDKQHKAISERAYMVMSNLIGEPAAQLTMTDVSGKVTQLYSIRSPFTVISFWDPNCGHCQKEMPVLDSMYQKKWKNEGVKIFGVLTDNQAKDKWMAFIREHKLNDWVNVYESDAQHRAVETAKSPAFQQLYDVIQTPTFYLLDNEKRIIAKKLTLEQMDDLITQKLKSGAQK